MNEETKEQALEFSINGGPPVSGPTDIYVVNQLAIDWVLEKRTFDERLTVKNLLSGTSRDFLLKSCPVRNFSLEWDS